MDEDEIKKYTFTPLIITNKDFKPKGSKYLFL